MRLGLHAFTPKAIVVALGVFLLMGSARSQTSDDELRAGADAYKNSRYQEAIRHFQRAVELDSHNLRVRMYLATAYTSQYIPGVDSPENLAFAEEAITHYQLVLDSGDGDQKTNSAKGIAYLYLNMKRFDEAKDYYEKVIGFDPTDPEPHYSIGVIDWTISYQARMEARSRLNLRPEDHLNSKHPAERKVCDDLGARYMTTIEDGIGRLEKAIQLRPDYDDAMAYLNLMYRERADLECDNPDGREQDLKKADEWVDRTLAVKKQKATKVPNPQ